MNKEQYLQQLKEFLHPYSSQIQQDILQSFQEHFAQGASEGKSDEQIIEQLGPIQQVIEEIKESYGSLLTLPSSSNYTGQPFTKLQICGQTPRLSFFQHGCDIEIERGEFYVAYQSGKLANLDYQDDTLIIPLDPKERLLKLHLPFDLSQTTIQTDISDISIAEVHIEQLDITSSSGDIELSNAKMDHIQINSKNGDIQMEHLTSQTIDVSTSHGDIQLKQVQAQDFNGQTLAGDIEVKYAQIQQVSLTTSAGDIDLDGQIETYNVQTHAGDIDVHLHNQAKHGSLTTSAGDIDYHGLPFQDCIVHVKTLIGDVDFPLHDGQSIDRNCYRFGNGENSFNFTSKVGDITIKA